MKTRTFLVAALIIVCVLFSSCGNDNQRNFIIGTDLLKYHSQGGTDFGFNINLISLSKDVDVEFVRFSGKNTDGLAVTLSDDSYDDLKSLKHNGYYITLLGFTCYTANENVQIDGVTLKIDGAETPFTFSVPIEHSIRHEEEDPAIQMRSFPAIISTNSYKETEYAFSYIAESDVVITGFSFNDFLIVNGADTYIDGKNIGRFENAFPLTLSKNSELSIKCYLGFKDNYISTDYDSIYCDSQLFYMVDGSSETMLFPTRLVSQSVSNEEDAKKVIDLMLGK